MKLPIIDTVIDNVFGYERDKKKQKAEDRRHRERIIADDNRVKLELAEKWKRMVFKQKCKDWRLRYKLRLQQARQRRQAEEQLTEQARQRRQAEEQLTEQARQRRQAEEQLTEQARQRRVEEELLTEQARQRRVEEELLTEQARQRRGQQGPTNTSTAIQDDEEERRPTDPTHA